METKDMENVGNETNEIGLNKANDKSRQVEEQDTADLMNQPFMRWNGVVQSWEHIKENHNWWKT